MFIGDVMHDDSVSPFGVEQEHAERRCVTRPCGLDAPSIPLDESLVDYGLDSVRIMTLLERWRREHAVDADFADLAERPEIEAWAALLVSAP